MIDNKMKQAIAEMTMLLTGKKKATNKYYLFNQEDARQVFFMFKHMAEKGNLSRHTRIVSSFFYVNEDVVAFQVENVKFCENNNGPRHFESQKERLEKVLNVDDMSINDVNHQMRETMLQYI